MNTKRAFYHNALRNTKDPTHRYHIQIVLWFDRNDDAITLCEIKYTQKPFVIDKNDAQTLQQKIDVFKKITGTRKQIFLAMISANRLKENPYSDAMVDQTVTLKDLFKAA